MVNKEIVPTPFLGFEQINRVWRQKHQRVVAKILPGQFYVTDQDEMIVTLLGSCIAACVRDTESKIGGMNHFMLPVTGCNKYQADSEAIISDAMRYGNYAMEHLINTILNYGGKRKNLEVKIFGGGKVIESLGSIGQRNVDFILNYIETEALALAAQDLGGIYPRLIRYFPSTGQVQLKKIQSLHAEAVVSTETRYQQRLKTASIEGSIELF
jgi:chemotaxis protein CheD